MVMPSVPTTTGRTAATPATVAMGGALADEEPPRFLPRGRLDDLLALLREDGRRVIGPTVGEGAIVYDEIASAADLPVGWTDRQAPGRYRLERTGTERAFDFVVGPTSWKRETFPPRAPLTIGRRVDGQITFSDAVPEPPALAFLGVRGCEIAALLTQDTVLARGPVVDRDYVARRSNVLIIAVECVAPAETCFCTSMGTGPEVTGGFDLAMTELDEGFVVRTGSPAGTALLTRLGLSPASDTQADGARVAVAAARARIGDPVPTEGLPARLKAAVASPHWAEVAERCLACANCTLVCPTCFCTSATQVSDLDGVEATAERTWDSCFTVGFAKVAGGNFRPRTQDRYRQWLTHKFGTWWDQFGMSGCVGCGRCITWCPVGIDVRAELLAVAPPPVEVADPVMLAATAATAPVGAGRRPHRRRRAPRAGGAALDHRSPADVPARLRRGTTSRDRRRRHVATRDRRSGTPRRSARAVRHGRAAGLLRRPDLRVALPRRRARPHGPSGRRRHARHLRAPAWRLGRPARTAGPRLAASRRPQGHDVLVVTGGIGLAPLRPLVDGLLAERTRFGEITLLYGARTPGDRLFVDELSTLGGRPDLVVEQTVDRAGPEWFGRVGVVTPLLDEARWDGSKVTAFICGPERMMEATVKMLRDRGVPDERVWLTLERHMECGVGLCGHCQLGPLFVCRDGPVVSLAELGPAFGREGL